MLSGSYSKKGMSVLMQAKRSENMAFRSRRSVQGISAFINNMPAFAYQHTYALPALYPYASQYAPGEWAFQGSFSYNFKRKTPLGGRYGTKVTVNASYISSLVHKGNPLAYVPDPNNPGQDVVINTNMGTNGSSSPFFKMGPSNYFDVNVQIEKRLSAPLQVSFMYMNQFFNNQVMKIVETDEKYIHTNIQIGRAHV